MLKKQLPKNYMMEFFLESVQQIDFIDSEAIDYVSLHYSNKNCTFLSCGNSSVRGRLRGVSDSSD